MTERQNMTEYQSKVRHAVTFLIAAGVGGLLMLALRSAWHTPYAPVRAEQTVVAPSSSMPKNEPTTSAPDTAKTEQTENVSQTAKNPVNTICAICGMKADPDMTAVYRDQVIAFGCKRCPEKFKQDPERYGPYFLRNEEAP
jgi:hypothetical protein